MAAEVTEAEFIGYVKNSYRRLAAAAWKGYEDDFSGGKGLLFAKVDNTVAPRGGTYPTLTCYYAEDVIDEFYGGYKKKTVDDIQKKVKQYDPNFSFVLFVQFKSDESEWVKLVTCDGERIEDIYKEKPPFQDDSMQDLLEVDEEFHSRFDF